MLTTAQGAALAAELQSDPKGLGYAALIASGADQSIADLGNALTGAGAENVTLPFMSRDDFLTAILPAVQALAGKDATTQSAWDRILSVARAADSIKLAVATPLIQELVAGGLLAADYAATIGVRIGSRFEVVLGVGVVPPHIDVAVALGRGTP